MNPMKAGHVRRVPCHGVPITYYDSAPDAPPGELVLLLHGTGGSASNNFWALFPMLAMRHRVLALDFVDPATGDPQGEHYVQQVLAVVQALHQTQQPAPRVHIVGYSFGAVIAALFAASHPELLHSLTLVAGWVKTDTQQRLRNSIWHQLHASDPDALAAFSVFTSYSQSFLNMKNEAEIAELIRAVRQGPSREAKMKFNQRVDIGEALSRIDTPSLVIACAHDQMAPVRHSRMLFGALKDCRYAEIKSGHGIVHERPSELFVMVDAFVRDPRRLPAGHLIHNSHA